MQEARRIKGGTAAGFMGLLTATYGLGQVLGPLLVVAAGLWRRLDPAPPRRRYSWELEEDAADPGDDALEPPRPDEVPVLWQRPEEPRGQVIPFRPRPPRGDA